METPYPISRYFRLINYSINSESLRETMHSLSKLRALHRDETGASYSISVLMIIPLYLAYLCVVIELALLFNTFQSVTSATQICGHSVRAWWLNRESLESQPFVFEELVRRSAMLNMLPFTSTNLGSSSSQHDALAQVLPQAGLNEFASQRYSQKARSIEGSVRLELTQRKMKNIHGVTVRLEYDSPLWFPPLATFLATGKNQHGYFRTISAETWVPIAETDWELQSTGIPYRPFEVRDWDRL